MMFQKFQAAVAPESVCLLEKVVQTFLKRTTLKIPYSNSYSIDAPRPVFRSTVRSKVTIDGRAEIAAKANIVW